MEVKLAVTTVPLAITCAEQFPVGQFCERRLLPKVCVGIIADAVFPSIPLLVVRRQADYLVRANVPLQRQYDGVRWFLDKPKLGQSRLLNTLPPFQQNA